MNTKNYQGGKKQTSDLFMKFVRTFAFQSQGSSIARVTGAVSLNLDH
jgi:hypothetical protein